MLLITVAQKIVWRNIYFYTAMETAQGKKKGYKTPPLLVLADGCFFHSTNYSFREHRGDPDVKLPCENNSTLAATPQPAQPFHNSRQESQHTATCTAAFNTFLAHLLKTRKQTTT